MKALWRSSLMPLLAHYAIPSFLSRLKKGNWHPKNPCRSSRTTTQQAKPGSFFGGCSTVAEMLPLLHERLNLPLVFTPVTLSFILRLWSRLEGKERDFLSNDVDTIWPWNLTCCHIKILQHKITEFNMNFNGLIGTSGLSSSDAADSLTAPLSSRDPDCCEHSNISVLKGRKKKTVKQTNK